MKKEVKRREYLETLWKLKDTELIKVITGVRRAGKSTLLKQFRSELIREVPAKRIQSYNFERREDYDLKTWSAVYDKIRSKTVKNKTNYVFLDEIQEVEEFERLLDALYVDTDIDLYVTGSNAYLLSSELATLLTGRSYTINILPFSFKEFYETYPNYKDRTEAFMDYLHYSSLPQSAELMHLDPSLVSGYVKEVFESIFQNDISARHNFASEKTFRDIVDFMADNIGNMFSPNSIAGILTASNKKIDSRTVENYLRYLVNSYVLYEVKRYDIKGKQLLKTQSKFYLSDIGFRNALLGRDTGADMGRMLENIVFLELIRRGNQVWVGKIGSREVDFIARDNHGDSVYYQVAYSVKDKTTLGRELRPFDMTQNHFPKILITMDPEETTWNGVEQINAVNWLLS